MKALALLLKERTLDAVTNPPHRRRVITCFIITFLTTLAVYASPWLSALSAIIFLVLQIIFDA